MRRILLAGGALLVLTTTATGCTGTVTGTPAPGATTTRMAAVRTPPPTKPETVTVTGPGLVPIPPSYDLESLTAQRIDADGELALLARLPPDEGALTCFSDPECAFTASGGYAQFVAHPGATITINNLVIKVTGVHGPDGRHRSPWATLLLSPDHR